MTEPGAPTDPKGDPHTDRIGGSPADRYATDVNEADIATAKIAPAPRPADAHGDVLAGGDATKAPSSLTAAECRPIAGASSGTSWDDPDGL